ncbi:MAG: hypothetical protein CML12_03085 [Puniceicoccaceae bacterium]|nr:hypothetical protein [Puniceicoccaceae bacterium]RCL30125.1 MAG: hypothetical protein DBX03_02915 [Puniceicoccaceae bacterium]|tara:strand:- start:2155 stop:2433 length:279 start_codon:yes stop_codon:yes gene_type:complete
MSASALKTIPWFSILFGILAILLFLFILVVTYLPNQPLTVDHQLKQERLEQAESIRAEGNKQLSQLVLKDADTAIIPIERAMELTLSEYRNK